MAGWCYFYHCCSSHSQMRQPQCPTDDQQVIQASHPVTCSVFTFWMYFSLLRADQPACTKRVHKVLPPDFSFVHREKGRKEEEKREPIFVSVLPWELHSPSSSVDSLQWSSPDWPRLSCDSLFQSVNKKENSSSVTLDPHKFGETNQDLRHMQNNNIKKTWFLYWR